MRLVVLIFLVSALCGCSEDPLLLSPKAGADDLDTMMLNDALTRLSPDERKLFGQTEEVRGFTFHGQKRRCVVIISSRRDIIKHAPDPAFCYHLKTNHYAGRL